MHNIEEERMMTVIKRSGESVPFHVTKIEAAIRKAKDSCEASMSNKDISMIADVVENKCKAFPRGVEVEQIQNFVEEELMNHKYYEVARHYIKYRYDRELLRKSNTTDDSILTLIEQKNETLKEENSNKNTKIMSTVRDYMAGEVSKDISRRFLLPKDILEAHDKGIIHFHDMDYFAQKMHNCCLVNLEDMLQNGTVISGTKIDKPHSFSTACNIATQIIAQVASCQYGGQTITMSHLAPFVDISRQKFRERVQKELEETYFNLDLSTKTESFSRLVETVTEERVREDIRRGVQTIQYQVLTLMTTNGQTPFVTVYLDINEVPEGQIRDDLAMVIEEVLRQRIKGVKNEVGVYITPAFPKLIYALDENNISEGQPYWYLTVLAAKCTAHRMVPDYISRKVMRTLKIDQNGDSQVYPCMGCRSFLTPYVDEQGKPKYYGRFNQGVVTLNLVDVACNSGGDMEAFWDILEDRLELCHKALRIRHKRLLGTTSDCSPIHWQNGALARLKKGEKIDSLLYNGYSTISLGYAGLAEMVYFMTGESHTSEKGKEFGLQVMQALMDATQKWKAAEHIDYSVYGTPIESTTYKFAKCLRKRFGVIPGVTDKNYITNSYHIRVTEPIDAFSKLTLESQFQKLSPGGAISYVEVPDMKGNIEAVLTVIQHIYNTILYAELNTKSDYCQVCGFDGEIRIVEDQDGKLVWECPNCGNRDESKLNVARRTCGYIGSQFWNQGRTEEIKDRVLHL